MRLSTAGTLALTILLATSILGAVVAAPPVSALDAEHGSSPAATDRFAADRSAQFGPSESPVVTPTLTATPSPPSTATASTATAPAPSLTASAAPLERADPQQIFRLTIDEDGHAQWTIETRFNLSDDDDVAIFREWAAEVAAGERAGGYDVQQFRTAVANAEHATNRQMSLEDPEWSHRVESPDDGGAGESESETRIGVLAYSFTWTNFAQVDDDRIYLGDAFHAPDDPMLPALYAGQRLVIEYPSNYALETPTQLRWEGPHQFADGELEIVFVRGAGGPWDAEWLSAGLIGVSLLLGGAAAGYLAYRYLRERDDIQLPGPIASLGSAAADDASSSSSSTVGTSTADTDAPSRPGADAATEASTQVAFEEDEDIDPELLSDEERVHRMLERNGGRMKQANIVKETGWSNAKVSQLLSQMDDDGKIEKLRIGRENLITLPEVDPTEVD